MAKAPTVLVVDDNEDIRELIKEVFKLTQWSVRTAKGGLEALDVLEGPLPDAVILDVRMPCLSGVDLARRLRGNPRTSKLLLVAVSGQPRGAYEEDDFDMAVQKPTCFSELAQRMKTFLDRRRQARSPPPERESRPSSGSWRTA